MNGTVFLYVAPIFDDDFSPIPSQTTSRANVYVFANDYIASNSCLWMHKRRRMDYGDEAFELVDHGFCFYICKKTKNYGHSAISFTKQKSVGHPELLYRVYRSMIQGLSMSCITVCQQIPHLVRNDWFLFCRGQSYKAFKKSIPTPTSPNLFNRMPSRFYFGKFGNEIRRFVIVLNPINVFFYYNTFQVCSRIFFN